MTPEQIAEIRAKVAAHKAQQQEAVAEPVQAAPQMDIAAIRQRVAEHKAANSPEAKEKQFKAAGAERRDARAAMKKEILQRPGVPEFDQGQLEEHLDKQFPTDEAQQMDDMSEASAFQRFQASMGSQFGRGVYNVANKVDNFVSDRFGKGEGGIVDDEKFAERDRKNALLEENTGLAGAAGRIAGDMVLTAPIDAVGGSALRMAGKGLMSTKKGAEWASKARAIEDAAVASVPGRLATETAAKASGAVSETAAAAKRKAKEVIENKAGLVRVRKARADARAAKDFKPTATGKEYDAKIASHRKSVERAEVDLDVAENAYGPLKQEAMAAAHRAQIIEDTWKAQRGPRGQVMDHMDEMFSENIHRDPTLRKLAGMDDMQFQANSMTRHIKGWQDVYRDGRRALKKADANAKTALDTVNSTTKLIDDAPMTQHGLVRARNKAMGKETQTVANKAKEELSVSTGALSRMKEKHAAAALNDARPPKPRSRAETGRMQREITEKAAQEAEDSILALGPKPRVSEGMKVAGRTLAGNTLGGTLGGGISGAMLAEEGDSFDAALTGAGFGGAIGAGQGALARGAGLTAAAAQKVPAYASYFQKDIGKRVVLRAASGGARKYKKNIVDTLEGFGEGVNPGGLSKTITAIRNVGAGNIGASYAQEEQYDGSGY